jgi:hypothetical protein
MSIMANVRASASFTAFTEAAIGRALDRHQV